MTTFEFPNNTITYFYFIPDLYDRVLVSQTKDGKTSYLAAIAIDGYIKLDENGEPSANYQYSQNFQPVLVQFSESAYAKLTELTAGSDAPFDPCNAVCVGIMRRLGIAGIQPFLALDAMHRPTRTDLRVRRGAQILMKAITDVTTLLPPMVPEPAGKKQPVEKDGKLPVAKTRLLHTLLDLANELPEEQLATLLTMVDAARSGKYVIRLKPGDIIVAEKQTTSGGKK